MHHNYFRNANSTQVMGLLADGSQDAHVPEGWLQCTEEEATLISTKGHKLSRTPDSLRAEIAAKRWDVETNGITLADGTFVLSSVEDQNRVFNAVTGYDLAGVERVRFKSASGFTWIGIEQLRATATPLARHTAACFNAEGDHNDAIDALVTQYADDPEGLRTALVDYDETQGWPATDLRVPGGEQ